MECVIVSAISREHHVGHTKAGKADLKNAAMT
jgi:hypothetical protein